MKNIRLRRMAAAARPLLSIIALWGASANAADRIRLPSEDIETEGFTLLEGMTVYGGTIKLIDGTTEQEYTRSSEVVKAISLSFPKIMQGYHQLLLKHELQHLVFWIKESPEFMAELGQEAESFGLSKPRINTENHLVREKAIVGRMQNGPILNLKEIVIWDQEEIDSGFVSNKRSRDIRYDADTQTWQRRLTTDWRARFNGLKNPYTVTKNQGLNLDTNHGYQEIDRGLGNQIHPSVFQTVYLSYPVIVNRSEPADVQIERLQHTLIENLKVIYDPFTWVALRKTRFRGGFYGEMREAFNYYKFKVTDRDWLADTLSHFLSDRVTIRRHGLEEVYSFYIVSRLEGVKGQLGAAFDPLNWNPDEKRETPRPRGTIAKKRWRFENAEDARFVLVDAHLEYGEAFTDRLRERLEDMPKKSSAADMVKDVLQEFSGVSGDTYIAAAFKRQTGLIEEVTLRRKK